MAFRRIQKMRSAMEHQISTIFPTIPKTKVTAYVKENGTLQLVEYIAHFLKLGEPTTGKLPLEIELAIAQARAMNRDSEKPPPKKQKSKAKPGASDEVDKKEIAAIREEIEEFEIDSSYQTLRMELTTLISRIRRDKKRSRFIEDEYLTKMAFAYSGELREGYIGLDGEEWKTWAKAHPEGLKDAAFCCGFVPRMASPIESIGLMLEHEIEKRKVVQSGVRYCGIGMSVSRQGSLFFAIFVANVE